MTKYFLAIINFDVDSADVRSKWFNDMMFGKLIKFNKYSNKVICSTFELMLIMIMSVNFLNINDMQIRPPSSFLGLARTLRKREETREGGREGVKGERRARRKRGRGRKGGEKGRKKRRKRGRKKKEGGRKGRERGKREGKREREKGRRERKEQRKKEKGGREGEKRRKERCLYQ